jgi:hypothetical protein
MAHGSYHFDNGRVGTNVMSVDAARNESISINLLDHLNRHFSYPEVDRLKKLTLLNWPSQLWKIQMKNELQFMI